MRLRASVMVVGVALVAGCATNRATQAPEAAPAPAEPAAQEKPRVDVDAAIKRERDPLPRHALQFPSGAFTAEIEASAAPTVTEHEGITEVVVPLEPNARMRCFVYPEYVDPGTVMVRLVNRAAGGVELQQFRPTAIVAQGINPLVFAEAVYLSNQNLGMLKLGAYATDDASFLCAHDEVGYRETFTRIVRGLAASLQKGGERTRDPEFGELQVIRIAGHDVGYERQRVFMTDEGRRADDVASMLLMPKSKTALSYQASFKITESDADGRLETLRFFETEDGEPKVQVEVERRAGKKNEYAYQGVRDGQPISGTFKSKDAKGLPGDRVLEAQFDQAFFSKEGASTAVEQYDPEIDPARPIEIPVKSLDARARTAQLTISGQQATGRFDDNGRLDRLELDLGGAALVQERVARVGDL